MRPDSPSAAPRFAAWRLGLLTIWLTAFSATLMAAPLSEPLPDHAATRCLGLATDDDRPGARIQAVGDIVLGNSFLVDNIPDSWDKAYFAEVRSVMQRARLLLGNLEGAISEVPTSRKTPGNGRQYVFRFLPKNAELLRKEGFTHLNVANNHALDFGDAGFAETLDRLKKAGVTPVGLRATFQVSEIDGLRVGFAGFTYFPSFNSVLDLEATAELVGRARAASDYLIVTFHAGAEGPSAAQHPDAEETFLNERRGNTVAFARKAVEAGADAVIGHGPHVLRGIECHAGKPIIYSLGNFVGVGGLNNRSLASASALLELELTPAGKLRALRLFPVRINERKLPVPDPQQIGVQLVNQLGRTALYPGTFLEFATPGAAAESAYARWYEAAMKGVPPIERNTCAPDSATAGMAPAAPAAPESAPIAAGTPGSSDATAIATPSGAAASGAPPSPPMAAPVIPPASCATGR